MTVCYVAFPGATGDSETSTGAQLGDGIRPIYFRIASKSSWLYLHATQASTQSSLLHYDRKSSMNTVCDLSDIVILVRKSSSYIYPMPFILNRYSTRTKLCMITEI